MPTWFDDPIKNKMIGAFVYRGISSLMFNLVCKSVKRPLMPALKSTIVKIPGSSDVYDAGGSFYDLLNVTIKIQYLGNDFYELRTRGNQIAAWLGGGMWGRIYIQGQDGYYVGKIEEEIDLSTMEETPFGEADIPFVCMPFSYGCTNTSLFAKGEDFVNTTNNIPYDPTGLPAPASP